MAQKDKKVWLWVIGGGVIVILLAIFFQQSQLLRGQVAAPARSPELAISDQQIAVNSDKIVSAVWQCQCIRNTKDICNEPFAECDTDRTRHKVYFENPQGNTDIRCSGYIQHTDTSVEEAFDYRGGIYQDCRKVKDLTFGEVLGDVF